MELTRHQPPTLKIKAQKDDSGDVEEVHNPAYDLWMA
jgi:hypothetical protein